MKRYQKKRFACGIACLILAVICGSVMAAEGVSVKLAVSALLLTALGGGDLLLSMDKTIQMPRPDERDPAGGANECLAGLPGFWFTDVWRRELYWPRPTRHGGCRSCWQP